jgi:hypothetical protein
MGVLLKGAEIASDFSFAQPMWACNASVARPRWSVLPLASIRFLAALTIMSGM